MRPKKDRPRRSPPAMERMEARTLLTAVFWTSQSSGDFNNAANWSTGKVPGIGDDVAIMNATVHIRLTNEEQNVNSLTTTAPLDLSGATLNVNGGGMTLENGAVVTEGNGSHLVFVGTQSIAGMGTIDFSGADAGSIDSADQFISNQEVLGALLTIGSGITIHGGSGTIGPDGHAASLDNQASIIEDTPGMTITLANGAFGTTLTNEGDLTVTAGELDAINGVASYWNSGRMTVSGSGVLVTTDCSTSQLNVLPGGTINIDDLHNQDQTLVLDRGTMGTISLAPYGSIEGGTITSSDGTKLVLGQTLNLTDVTLGPGSPIDLASASTQLSIFGDLTLADATLDIPPGNAAAIGNVNLDGTGELKLGASASLNVTDVSPSSGSQPYSPGYLMISPNITVDGAGTLSETPQSTIANSGRIAANNPGETLTIVTNGGTFSNAGVLDAADGGTLSLQGDYNSAPSGSVDIGVGANGAGSLAINGIANLAGNLNVSLLDNFVPPVNKNYDVVTYSSINGAFAAINLPTAPGVEFTSTIGPTGISIATSTPPPPTVPELLAQVADDRVMLSQATMTRRRTMADLIHTRNRQLASLRTARRQLLQLQRENKKHPSDSLAAEIAAVTTQIDDLSRQLGDTQQSLAADRTTDFTGITAASHTLSADVRTLRQARLHAKKHA